MSILDDNDPIVILSNSIIGVLDKHEGDICIAALAATLGTVLGYASVKTGIPPSPDMAQLRRDLTDLVVEVVRDRDLQRES